VRRRDGRPGDDRGAVTAFVVVFSMALLFTTGLVLDGGRILTSKREARNAAQSAARAGAQEFDDLAIRNNLEVILDPGAAEAAACEFADRAGFACPGEVTVDTVGNEVIVTITHSVEMTMLVGVPAQTYTVEGRACVARGIEAATC
jgi:Flp pilus assembly protein TadG